MYVCMYAYVYVRYTMYICMYCVCMYVGRKVGRYVYVYVSYIMYICVYVWMDLCR